MTKRIFILGAHGRLGTELCRAWQQQQSALDAEVIGLGRTEIDFSDPQKAHSVFEKQDLRQGDIIVNTAAITDVDRAEREQDLATAVNATTPGLLAALAEKKGARFIHLSTDYVFDGKATRPYCETDEPRPLSHYGVTKLAAEKAVMTASPEHVVTRVSWVFGPDRPSFIDQIIKQALTTTEVAAVHDKISSPTYTKDLAEWLMAFLNPEMPGGLYHLCNSGPCSWKEYGEYALHVAEQQGIPVLTTTVAPLTMKEVARFVAARPPYTPFDTTKFSSTSGLLLRSWKEAVVDYIQTYKHLYS